MNKLAYKPISLALGATAGALAGVVFRQVWKRVSGEDDAPDATDEGRSWSEVLLAAAIQGAIFAIVKAAIDRGGAAGIRQLTGEWPD